MKKYKIAYANVTGRGHKKDNIPCQDKVSGLVKNEITILSLADGAGCATYADIGAEETLREANALLSSFFNKFKKMDNNEIRDILYYFITQVLEQTAIDYSTSIKQLSSTLLFVVTDGEYYIIGHIGDGVIGSLSSMEEETTMTVMSHPQNGKFCNQTFFTTSTKEAFRIYKGKMENIIGFIVMSDGSAESLYYKKTKKMLAPVQQIFTWLQYYDEKFVSNILNENLENIIAKNTYDDCSIGLFVND